MKYLAYIFYIGVALLVAAALVDFATDLNNITINGGTTLKSILD